MDNLSLEKFKEKIIVALETGKFRAEMRKNINDKNLLVLKKDLYKPIIINTIKNCTRIETKPHHWLRGVKVHIIKQDDWYIKFYFRKATIYFISVHK